MKHLAKLKSLCRLDLQNTEVTDAGLKELASLKSLTRLYLSDFKGRSDRVTKAGVKELQQALPNCRIRLYPWPP
jgi:hypothetical protein